MEKVFNRTAHRDLWGWLAENPDKEKHNWPGWQINGGEVQDSSTSCLACDYVEDIGMGHSWTCLRDCCPIMWPSKSKKTYQFCGLLFYEWSEASEKSRIRLAKKIRDLPVREGVKCI